MTFSLLINSPEGIISFSVVKNHQLATEACFKSTFI